MACSIDIGHALKTILLRLGSNIFDVSSDVWNGLYHYYPKNVTRYLGNGSGRLPANCTLSPEHNASEMMFTCAEEDTVFAALTFTFIQMPAIILAIFTVLGSLAKGCREGFGSDQAKKFLSVVLLLLVPFPLLIFVQQVASIFIRTDQMEYWSILFLFGEGSLEAPPQLLLMMYIIFPLLREGSGLGHLGLPGQLRVHNQQDLDQPLPGRELLGLWRRHLCPRGNF